MRKLVLSLLFLCLSAQATITTTALGTAQRLSGASPWTAFTGIALVDGDLLVLTSASSGCVNNVAWNGHPLTIGAISAGISDACITYLFVTAATAGTGDVVITANTLAAVVALRKVTGVAGFDVVGQQNGDPFGTDPHDPAVTTRFVDEFFIGVMGAGFNFSSFSPGTWQQGWTGGQLAGNTSYSLHEGYKIASGIEASQASIVGQSLATYWMCHVTFRATAPPGTVSNLRVLGSTPTQIVFAYTKSSSAPASFRLSENSAYSPVVNDVDGAKYAGSNLDTRSTCSQVGREVTCALGTRTLEYSSLDGKTYSRALKAGTLHYLEVTGPDASTATLIAKTAPLATGHWPHGEWERDSFNVGKVAQPTRLWTRGQQIVEPKTGATLQAWSLPGDVKRKYGPAALTDGGTVGGKHVWSLPSIDIATDDRWGVNLLIPRWVSFTANIWFTGNDLSAPSRTVDICWGTQSAGTGVCQSPIVTITAGTTSASFTICNQTGSATCTDGEYWGDFGKYMRDIYALSSNPNFAFMTVKHVPGADNTLNITSPQYAIGAGGIAAGSSAGFFPVCSGEMLSVNGFMHCMDAVGKTYSIKPDTGETRYIGTPVADLNGQGRAVVGILPVLWEDANHWFASSNGSIYRLALATAAQNDDPTPYMTVDGGAESWYDAAFTDMLGGQKIADLIKTFDPSFDKTTFVSGGITSYNAGRYLTGVLRIGNQDTYAWAWVYDLGNHLPLGLGGTGSLIAAFPTYSSATKVAWSVNHGQDVLLNSSKFIGYGNTIAKEDTTGNQKFHLIYKDYWNGSAFVVGNMPSDPSVRVRFTSTWNGAWGTQPGAFQTGDPLSSTQSPHWLQKVAVGNNIFLDNNLEKFQVTAINGQDSNGLDLTLSRQQCGTTYQTIAAGASLMMQPRCDLPNGASFLWNFIQGPNGQDAFIYPLDLPGGGHQVITRDYQIGTPEVGWHACNIDADASCTPVNDANITEAVQRSEPYFATVFAPINGNSYEGHPGLYPESGGGIQRPLDIHPLIFTFTDYDQTLVTGSLWKLTNPHGSPFYTLHRKVHPTLAGAGSGFSAQDVSGPSSSIGGTSSDHYKCCVVLLANECRTGSSPGDIFVNSPTFATQSPMCTGLTGATNDLCIEDLAPEGLAVGMYTLTGLNEQAQNIGLYRSRSWVPLVQTLGIPAGKGLPNTSNVKMFNLNWGWYGQYLLRLPRAVALDSVARNQFAALNVAITDVPPSTDNVVAEFGYAEQGDPALYYCASRRETCNAVSSTITQSAAFYWSSETFSGLSCSSGCTVAIPVLPAHTVFYRLKYRDSGNAVILTTPMKIAAVP